MDLRTAAPG